MHNDPSPESTLDAAPRRVELNQSNRGGSTGARRDQEVEAGICVAILAAKPFLSGVAGIALAPLGMEVTGMEVRSMPGRQEYQLEWGGRLRSQNRRVRAGMPHVRTRGPNGIDGTRGSNHSSDDETATDQRLPHETDPPFKPYRIIRRTAVHPHSHLPRPPPPRQVVDTTGSAFVYIAPTLFCQEAP